MKKLSVIIFCLFFSRLVSAQTQEEFLVLKEAGNYYLTKFDSTLEYSVLNASKIVVFNHTLPISKNIGREINFSTVNEKTEKKTINTRIVGTATYNGEEKYVIELTLNYKDLDKKVKLILADLSADEQKLIAGKNWLK